MIHGASSGWFSTLLKSPFLAHAEGTGQRLHRNDAALIRDEDELGSFVLLRNVKDAVGAVEC